MGRLNLYTKKHKSHPFFRDGFCVYSSAASLYLLSDILPAVSMTPSSISAEQSGAHILG